MPQALLRLSDVTREASRRTGRPVTYREIYMAVLSGQIPTSRVGREFRVDSAQMDAVAALFSETPQPPRAA